MSGTLTHAEYEARRHLPVLDGVRAVSILLVVTHHPIYPGVWPAFHGATGVSIFFVLSGFLITMLLLREERRTGRISLSAFYTRRLFRLAPMFLIAFSLYVVMILGLGLQADRRASFVENIPYYLLFLPEHALFFNSYPEPVPFGGTWSLGIEEKFYFIWPVLGFVLLKLRSRARFIALAVVFAFSTVCSIIAGSWGMALAPYGLLAVGCALAIVLDRPRSYAVASRLGEKWVLLGSCAVFLALQFGTDAIVPERHLYVLYGIVIAAVLGGLVVSRARWIGWLHSRPLVLIGTLSYGLYLFHNFGINLVEMIVPQTNFGWSLLSTSIAFGLSLLGVWVLHLLVERPCFRVGHRLSKALAVRPFGVSSLRTMTPRPARALARAERHHQHANEVAPRRAETVGGASA